MSNDELSIIYKEFPLILHNEEFTVWEGYLALEVKFQFLILIFIKYFIYLNSNVYIIDIFFFIIFFNHSL